MSDETPKRKRGRPQKAPGDRATVQIGFRVTPAEAALLDARAAPHGTKSDAARAIVRAELGRGT